MGPEQVLAVAEAVCLDPPSHGSTPSHPFPPAVSAGFREAVEAARQRLVAIAADNKADPEVGVRSACV